jgi:hypothetical protein
MLPVGGFQAENLASKLHIMEETLTHIPHDLTVSAGLAALCRPTE